MWALSVPPEFVSSWADKVIKLAAGEVFASRGKMSVIFGVIRLWFHSSSVNNQSNSRILSLI